MKQSERAQLVLLNRKTTLKLKCENSVLFSAKKVSGLSKVYLMLFSFNITKKESESLILRQELKNSNSYDDFSIFLKNH